MPRVAHNLRLPPGNPRWIALSGGVVALSVAVAVLVGTLGLFGFGTGDSGTGRQIDAKVVTAQACAVGAMETVLLPVDGQDRQATLDGCGHQQNEPIQVTVVGNAGSGDLVVRLADANTGAGDDGRKLGLVLLVLAGIAGAGYALLYQRGPRGRPITFLGALSPPKLRTRRQS
jgi:hypothetical protein